LQVKVKLKPEFGALVQSSGALRKGVGWGPIQKVFCDNEQGAEMKAHILL